MMGCEGQSRSMKAIRSIFGDAHYYREHIVMRAKAWFQRWSTLVFVKLLLFIFFWCENKMSVVFCSKELDKCPSDLVDLARNLSQVCAEENPKTSGKWGNWSKM